MEIILRLSELNDAERRWISREAERTGQSVPQVVYALIHQGLHVAQSQPSATELAPSTEQPEESAGTHHAIGDMDITDPAMWQ